MEEFAVAGDILDGVADGVAEIEQGPQAGALLLVLRHDPGLDRDVAGDERREGGARGGGIEVVEHGGVADDGVLDDLGKAFAVFAVGQGFEREGIGEHQPWLVEGADEVFTGTGVDAGLAADGAVDLRDDGGGNLHAGDAAEVDGGDESGEVANHPAAEGDDKRTAVEAGGEQPVDEAFRGGHGLGILPRGDGEQLRGESRGCERFDHGGAVEGPDIFVGDDRASSAQSGAGAKGPGLREQTRSSQHAAGASGKGDGNLDHAAGGPPAATSAAPTSPAWFCSWAGTTGTLTMPWTTGRNLSALRLTPPPMMKRSGLKRNA